VPAPTLKVAAVQAAPVFLDLEASLDKATSLTKTAAAASPRHAGVVGWLGALLGFPQLAINLSPLGHTPMLPEGSTAISPARSQLAPCHPGPGGPLVTATSSGPW
jgi:hypothetical protein